MRVLMSAGLLAGLLLSAGSALAEKIVDGRYIAPGGEFSIAMQATADKLFKVDKEGGNADMVLIDLQYARAQAHSGFAQRTIEWLKLAAPLDPASFDARAGDTVSGYLEGRFAGSAFTITDRRKARDAAGQLIYTFAATGTVNGKPAAWVGALLFFDSGVALVSQLYTPDTKPMLDADGATDAELAQWAGTIRPGK